jgi:hypothetical protein
LYSSTMFKAYFSWSMIFPARSLPIPRRTMSGRDYDFVRRIACDSFPIPRIRIEMLNCCGYRSESTHQVQRGVRI